MSTNRILYKESKTHFNKGKRTKRLQCLPFANVKKAFHPTIQSHYISLQSRTYEHPSALYRKSRQTPNH